MLGRTPLPPLLLTEDRRGYDEEKFGLNYQSARRHIPEVCR
jgi:hypothetical protein